MTIFLTSGKWSLFLRFLSLPGGKSSCKILITNKYGAVITHIESEHLDTVPIPNAPDSIKSRINDLILKSYDLRDYRRCISEAARLSVFCVRILRFSQAKILGFFLWLSAKKLKRQFVPHACSARQIFY